MVLVITNGPPELDIFALALARHQELPFTFDSYGQRLVRVKGMTHVTGDTWRIEGKVRFQKTVEATGYYWLPFHGEYEVRLREGQVETGEPSEKVIELMVQGPIIKVYFKGSPVYAGQALHVASGTDQARVLAEFLVWNRHVLGFEIRFAGDPETQAYRSGVGGRVV